MGAELAVIDGPKRLTTGTKRAEVLRIFLERGDSGMTCFEAVRLCHDYVLRSTVSELSRLFGVEFNRRYEQVPGFNGSRVDCVRYSLTRDGAARARRLLSLEGQGAPQNAPQPLIERPTA